MRGLFKDYQVTLSYPDGTGQVLYSVAVTPAEAVKNAIKALQLSWVSNIKVCERYKCTSNSYFCLANVAYKNRQFVLTSKDYVVFVKDRSLR